MVVSLQSKITEIREEMYSKREALIKEGLQRALLIDVQSSSDIEEFLDRLSAKEYLQSHTEYLLDGECFLWIGKFKSSLDEDNILDCGFDYKFMGAAL
jgi:hypothetical protein